MSFKSAASAFGSAIGSAIDYSTLSKLRTELREAEPIAEAQNQKVADLKAQIEAIQKRLKS